LVTTLCFKLQYTAALNLLAMNTSNTQKKKHSSCEGPLLTFITRKQKETGRKKKGVQKQRKTVKGRKATKRKKRCKKQEEINTETRKKSSELSKKK
jgi:hypothetical protein